MSNMPKVLQTFEEVAEIPIVRYPSGVYFLMMGEELVYIGQSVQPLVRIAQHNGIKDFDSAYLIPIPKQQLDQVEGALIRYFTPRLNYGTEAQMKGVLRAPGIPVLDRAVLVNLGVYNETNTGL